MPLNFCTISGQVQLPDGSPAKNVVVTFDSVRTQVVQGSFTIAPVRVSSVTDSNGDLTAISLAQGLVVQISVGGATPFTAVVPFLTSAQFSELATTVLSTLTTTGLLQTLTFTEIPEPGVSGAGQGLIYLRDTTHRFRISTNGGAYQDILVGQVATAEIQNLAVTTAKIADGAVTGIKTASEVAKTNVAQTWSQNQTLANGIQLRGLLSDGVTGHRLAGIGSDDVARFGSTGVAMELHSSVRPQVVIGSNPATGVLLQSDVVSKPYDIGVWVPGTLAVQNGIAQRLFVNRNATFTTLAARVETAAGTGGTTIDVKKNGVSAGSVTIPAASNSATATVSISVVSGDRLRFDITAVGSGPSPADLSVVLVGTSND
jgi:hypothetical protein